MCVCSHFSGFHELVTSFSNGALGFVDSGALGLAMVRFSEDLGYPICWFCKSFTRLSGMGPVVPIRVRRGFAKGSTRTFFC